jgi:hypothetical protein
VHAVVDDFGVPSTHVDAPVTHEVTPFRHTDGFVVHAVPAVHATHVPLPLHTWLLPQVVPAAVLPVSRQRGAPVEQSTTPVLHGAPGLVVHAVPAAHARHCPLPLHTMFEPHAVPARALSASMQPDDIPHVTTPSLHGAPGLVAHTVPAAHVVHAPVLQTLSVPQFVPSGASASSIHCGAPVAHAIAPFLHGLPALVVHDAPDAHGMHVAAALHTCPTPQVAPAFLAVPFEHPAGSQTVMPFVHGSLLVVHAIPARQSAHAPSMHNLFIPQIVPLRALPPSTQVRPPSLVHATRPSRQGAPGFVAQLSSAGHDDVPSVPPSRSPDPAAASTMPPICSGDSPLLQPVVRQHTPTATGASRIRSQLKPDGHLGAAGSHTTRAFGMLGLSVQPVASTKASAASKRVAFDTARALKTATGRPPRRRWSTASA